MFRIDFATIVIVGVVYVGLKLSNGEALPSHGLLDVLMFFGFFAFLWWLLRERNAAVNANGSESADQSFAFRLGKLLKRVRG